MVGENRIRNIGFLSTYPPRECGLATFTEDLVNEISKMKSLIQSSVIAVVNKEEYANSQVKFKLNQHNRTSYLLRHSGQMIIWIFWLLSMNMGYLAANVVNTSLI